MLRLTLIGLLACLSLCLAWVSPALAETRAALVIGNAAYAHAPRLANPERDAQMVAAALRQVGFEDVTLRQNLDSAGLRAALQAFAAKARRADVAVIYYAGHGMELGGINYLIPIDATLATDSDVRFEATPLELVLEAAGGASRLKVVILDACRDNPFTAGMRRTGGTRSVSRGLTRIEPESDMLVAYAAREGATADDGNSANSPFASAFVRRLTTSTDDVRIMFGQVRDDVRAATGGAQDPAVYSSLGGKPFYFKAPTGAAQVSTSAAAAPDPRTMELAFWESIKSSANADDFQAYIDKYPRGEFIALARNRARPGLATPSVVSPLRSEDVTAAASAQEAFDKGGYAGLEPWIAKLQTVLGHGRVGLDGAESDAAIGRAGRLVGMYYNEHRDFSRAMAALEVGRRAAPRDPQLISEIGVAYNGLQNWTAALATYDQGLAIDTLAADDRARLYRGRGFALTELRRFDEAEYAYRKALELVPNHGGALAELRYIAGLRAGSASTGMNVLSGADAANRR